MASPKMIQVTPSMASPKMNLKLVVDKKGQRVLFAEASKEFVDFLFQTLSLPLGTLIEFLGSEQMVGCLGKLKDGIQSFNETHLQPGISKTDIINPKTALNRNMFLLSYDASAYDCSATSITTYGCYNATKYCSACKSHDCCIYVTQYSNARCPTCDCFMTAMKTSVLPEEEKAKEALEKERRKGGYVKDIATYMVMDDLVVKPMSTISFMALVGSFDVKDLSQLEEKVVSFGKDEALKMLKASSMTDKVLSTVFLDNSFEAIAEDGDSVANKPKKRTRRN